MLLIIKAKSIIPPKEPMLIEVCCCLAAKAQAELINLIAGDERRYRTYIEIAGRGSRDIVVYKSLRKPGKGAQEFYIHSKSQYSPKDVRTYSSATASILIWYHPMPIGSITILGLWFHSSFLGYFTFHQLGWHLSQLVIIECLFTRKDCSAQRRNK